MNSVSYAENSTQKLENSLSITEASKADSIQSPPSENLSDINFKQEGYTAADSIDSFESNPTTIDDFSTKDIGSQANATNGTSGPALSLLEACQLAISNHPLVESSRSSRMESEADYGIAKSVYMPRIDLNAQVGPSHNLDTDTTKYGEGSVSVTQTLFDFGGLQDGVASAKLKADSAKLRLARTNEDIAALAVNSYFTILQAQELLNVQNDALDFYNQLLDTFWERFNAGISSKADAAKVEVSLRATQSQLTVQNQQLKTAKLLLENIIRQTVHQVETNVGLLKIDITQSLDESYASALENNVSLRAFTADIHSQEKVVSVKDSEYLPSIGYRLQAKNEMQKIDGYKATLDAQVTLDWNLFNGFATDERVKKEQAVLRRMVATKHATELEIKNILSDAFNAYNSSVKEFELAKEAYDGSVYLMGLYLSEFDLGIRTLLDLITAREGQTSAAVREVNARFARIRSTLNIILEEGRLASILGLKIEE
ncbi:MAG: transporter [Desulfovibrio sp. S3730MH75]|nr:MAG: transporter [Desulfovibrio sp. S3730MH75]